MKASSSGPWNSGGQSGGSATPRAASRRPAMSDSTSSRVAGTSLTPGILSGEVGLDLDAPRLPDGRGDAVRGPRGEAGHRAELGALALLGELAHAVRRPGLLAERLLEHEGEPAVEAVARD